MWRTSPDASSSSKNMIRERGPACTRVRGIVLSRESLDNRTVHTRPFLVSDAWLGGRPSRPSGTRGAINLADLRRNRWYCKSALPRARSWMKKER